MRASSLQLLRCALAISLLLAGSHPSYLDGASISNRDRIDASLLLAVATDVDAATDRASPVSLLVYNVVDYGASPSGTVDVSASVQSAVSALQATGGVLYFPSGTYLFNPTVGAATGGSFIHMAYNPYVNQSASTFNIVGAGANATTMLWNATQQGLISILSVDTQRQYQPYTFVVADMRIRQIDGATYGSAISAVSCFDAAAMSMRNVCFDVAPGFVVVDSYDGLPSDTAAIVPPPTIAMSTLAILGRIHGPVSWSGVRSDARAVTAYASVYFGFDGEVEGALMLDGCTFVNTNVNMWMGNASTASISECTFDDCWQGVTVSQSATLFDVSARVRFDRCTFTSIGLWSLSVQGNPYVQVDACTFASSVRPPAPGSSTAQAAIGVWPAQLPTVSRVNITMCTFSDMTVGVHVQYGAVMIAESQFDNVDLPFYYEETAWGPYSFNITRVSFVDSSRAAAIIQQDARWIMQGCVCEGDNTNATMIIGTCTQGACNISDNKGCEMTPP